MPKEEGSPGVSGNQDEINRTADETESSNAGTAQSSGTQEPEVLPPEDPPTAKKRGRKKSETTVTDVVKKDQPEEPVNTQLVDEAVEFINTKFEEYIEKANESVYNWHIDIGKYILEKFFNNDLKEATSRNPRKAVSYRALRERSDLEVKPPELSVMVHVAAQEKFFQKYFTDEKDNLSYTIKAELTKLPYDESNEKLVSRKKELVRQIIDEKLTSRNVRERVQQLKATSEGTSTFLPVKYFDTVDNLVAKKMIDKFSVIMEKLPNMHKDTRFIIKEKAETALKNLGDMTKNFDSLIKKINELEKREEQKKPAKSGKKGQKKGASK